MIITTPKFFGLAIRARRWNLFLTQDDLARHLGVSRQWVIDLEKGKTTVGLGLTLRAFAALNLELSLLMEPKCPPWTEPLTAAALARKRDRDRRRRAPRPLPAMEVGAPTLPTSLDP